MIVSFDPAREAAAIHTGDHTDWYSAHQPDKALVKAGDEWHHIDAHRRYEVIVSPGAWVECLRLTVKVSA